METTVTITTVTIRTPAKRRPRRRVIVAFRTGRPLRVTMVKPPSDEPASPGQCEQTTARPAALATCQAQQPPEDKHMVTLSCAEIGFPNIVIQTAHENLMCAISHIRNSRPKQATLFAFMSICDALKKYTEEEAIGLCKDNHERVSRGAPGNLAWQNFCDDVCLWWAARYVIFGVPIRLVAGESTDALTGDTVVHGIPPGPYAFTQ